MHNFIPAHSGHPVNYPASENEDQRPVLKEQKICLILLHSAPYPKITRILRDKKTIGISRILYVPKVSDLEKSQGIGGKGYVMLVNIPSLENLNPVTIHEYLSIHLLASDDHLTPMRGPWFYILLRVKCALFLHDSCSSSQQTPKAHNLRKILWIIP